MWQWLVDHLALTSTERKVILFLAGTLLLGSGIRLYREAFPHQRQFDYRSSDSTFAGLSRRLLADSVAPKRTASSTFIDINTATKPELVRLPGIGDAMADRILQLRSELGAFHRTDDLLRVKGITKKRLEQIKNFITIDSTENSREQ